MIFELFVLILIDPERKICLWSWGRDELDSAQDLPLQCDFRALYVGLVGALYFQYPLLRYLLNGFHLFHVSFSLLLSRNAKFW